MIFFRKRKELKLVTLKAENKEFKRIISTVTEINGFDKELLTKQAGQIAKLEKILKD